MLMFFCPCRKLRGSILWNRCTPWLERRRDVWAQFMIELLAVHKLIGWFWALPPRRTTWGHTVIIASVGLWRASFKGQTGCPEKSTENGEKTLLMCRHFVEILLFYKKENAVVESCVMKYEVWNIFYMYSLLLSLNILFNLNCGNLKFEGMLLWKDISSLKPCTVDDTSECEFARAVKRKKDIKLLGLFFTAYLPHNFHKSKIGTWTRVAQLPSQWALSEGPFNRKMCGCICLFFFSSLAHPFPFCGCWPNQLKRVLKTVFHYTAKSMHLWCIFMQHDLHLHIFCYG